MASFKAKTGQDRLRVIQKKNVIVPIHSNSIMIREFLKNSKKMQKFKEHHYGFISSQNGSREAEKEKFFFSLRSVPTQPGIENSKTIAKKLKNIIMASFQAKTGWDSL